jgi:hypothetical protein
MTTVAGIEIEKNINGHDAFIRIDLEKYGKLLQPFLQEIGMAENEEDEFEREWKTGITGEELVKRVTEHIKTLPWKK